MVEGLCVLDDAEAEVLQQRGCNEGEVAVPGGDQHSAEIFQWDLCQPQRTSLGSSRDIYPEKEDREIMCLAMRLAEIPLEDFGAVLVATRDSDFTLVAPSLLENLGFGVIKNAQTLNQWSAR